MRGFFSALRFLTVLPVPGRAEWSPRAAAPWFPVVGLLIGAAAALAARLAGAHCGLAVTVALAVLSGGLHLDGLADCADGFLARRGREQALAIMKDSRIGVMGVLAVLFVVLAKIRGVDGSGELAWRAALLMPVAGRSMILLMMALLPYARKEGGIGAMFYGRGRWPAAAWGLAFLYLCAWFLAGRAGLAAAAAAVATALVFSLISWLVIGGATGDTLGAVSELAETAAALALAQAAISNPI